MNTRRENLISLYVSGNQEVEEKIKAASKTFGLAILTGMGIGLGFYLIKKVGVKW